jgi:hypothetical protein
MGTIPLGPLPGLLVVTLSKAKGLSMGTEMLRGVYPERSEGLSMTGPTLNSKIQNRRWAR